MFELGSAYTVPGTLNKYLWSEPALLFADMYVMGKENSIETTFKYIFKMAFLFLQL